MDTDTDETLDFLRIKPLPKKVSKPLNFFIEKKQEQELPTVIDKTSENLVDVKEFLDKIQSKLGVQGDNKIHQDKAPKPVNMAPGESSNKTPYISVSPLPKQNLYSYDTFVDLVKTDILIKLLPFGVYSKANPNKPSYDLPKVESTKKNDYKKKYIYIYT